MNWKTTATTSLLASLPLLVGCSASIDSEAVDALAHEGLGYVMGCDAKRQGLTQEQAMTLARDFAQQRETYQHGEQVPVTNPEVEQWADGSRTGWEECKRAKD